jgi:dTDP-4-amino-4,6-dideoxygalactose transaminase
MGCIPAFVDVDIPSYNVNVDQLKEAISDKTKACPFSMSAVFVWETAVPS